MPPTLTEQLNTMYTTTWYLRRKEVVDNIFNATPLANEAKGASKSTLINGRTL